MGSTQSLFFFLLFYFISNNYTFKTNPTNPLNYVWLKNKKKKKKRKYKKKKIYIYIYIYT